MLGILTAGGDGGRFDRGRIRFCGRSFEQAVLLYDVETGGSGGERGFRLNSGDLYKFTANMQISQWQFNGSI